MIDAKYEARLTLFQSDGSVIETGLPLDVDAFEDACHTAEAWMHEEYTKADAKHATLTVYERGKAKVLNMS